MSCLPFNTEVRVYGENSLLISKNSLSLGVVELNGHFVFELSLRDCGNDSGSQKQLFVSYKGFGHRVASGEPAQELNIHFTHADNTETWLQSWILADVPVTITKQGNVDLQAPFSAFLPGCGLIDVSMHDAYPYKRQDLTLFKDEIISFVSEGLRATLAPTPKTVDEHHNVLVRKVAFDKFQYLLCLTKPKEKGQAVALDFPTVKCTLNSGKYNDTKFCQMHVIDETLRTLCLEDLQVLLAWLFVQILPSTRYSHSSESDGILTESIHVAIGQCRRLYWVSRRIAAAIGDDRLSQDDIAVCEALYFGRQTRSQEDEWSKLSHHEQADFSAAISAQIELEMKYALELDHTCGTRYWLEWCSKCRDLFESVIKTIAQSYISAPDKDSTKLSTLLALVKNHACDFSKIEVLDDFVCHFSDNSGLERIELANGYVDAMALVSEIAFKIPAKRSLETVACVADLTSSERPAVIMRRAEDVRVGKAIISAEWYRGLFLQIFSTTITSFGFTLDSCDVDDFDLDKILAAIRPIIIGDSKVMDPLPILYEHVLLGPTQQKGEYVPCSHEFFLGLVWPTLRNIGWHADAGGSPSEVTFCPKSITRKRYMSSKFQRDRKRSKLAVEINLVGLGVVVKATKRLLVAVTENREFDGSIGESDPVDSPEQTVKVVLDQFCMWIINKFVSEPDFAKTFASTKVIQLVRGIQHCFDACAPMLSPIPGLPPAIKEGLRPMELYRCEYLMQFLLVLPSALRHAMLPSQDLNDCMVVVRDLLSYLTEHHSAIFEKRFHPPEEKYMGTSEAKSLIESKINFLLSDDVKPSYHEVSGSSGAACHGELTELIREEDKVGLTDFVITVLEQALPFQATEDDVRKKNGRVQLGFPGVVCRHCMGYNFEGRYFFSTTESLTASYTVLEKHFFKCLKTPVDVKRRLVETRSRHAEQRKTLPSGSQQAFFTHLWSRLHKTKPPAQVARRGMSSSERNSNNADPSENSNEHTDFSDHIILLNHVRRDGKLRNNKELQEAMDRYYSCLEYAGRVYATESMPKHFSSNWLLSKVLPKLHNRDRQRKVG